MLVVYAIVRALLGAGIVVMAAQHDAPKWFVGFLALLVAAVFAAFPDPAARK